MMVPTEIKGGPAPEVNGWVHSARTSTKFSKSKCAMKHAFISYVGEDRSLAQRLAHDLELLGANVWLDKDRLSPGQRWRDVIRSAIRSGNFFIACFSGAYWSRDQSFMNEELAIAVEQLRRFRSDRSWFIPVLLSPCVVPELPIGGSETLQDIQHVDLGEDWNKGVAEIARVIRSESGGPTPAPAIAVRAFMSRGKFQSDLMPNSTLFRSSGW